MKKSKFIITIGILGFLFSSCKPEVDVKTTVVDFENVKLNSDSISIAPSFVSGNSTFTINNNAFWNGGIICSAKNDTITAGYKNQYSSIAGVGAINSRHFGLVYSPGSFICPANINGNYSIKSLMVTNSTYAYLDMKNGSTYGKKFVVGDWFKVVIKGFKEKIATSSIDIFLADFRNGKNEILQTWRKVDISALGQVDSVAFAFDSSDKDPVYGMNTPAYVCIDNIEFTQSISTK